MGNKQSRAIYEIIQNTLKTLPKIAKAQTVQSISDQKIVDHLIALITEKISADKPTKEKFEEALKEIRHNVPKEDSKEEKEAKEKKAIEAKIQSNLVAGHEQLPEIKNIFEGASLEDFVSPTKESVREYTKRIGEDFMSAIGIMLSKAEGSGEAISFFSRIESCLNETEKDSEIECSGASTALYFAALLIDPTKLMTDPQISANLLDMFQTMKPLSFYGWTKKSLTIENSINSIKDSLIKQLEIAISENPIKSMACVEKLIMTIFLIGLARGSIEDLLVAIELIIKSKANFEMNNLLEKVMELPKVDSYLDTCSININKDSLQYEIPFEKIYLNKRDWIVERELSLSSATDGENIYFYSSVHGLLSLGVGKTMQKGKIYAKGGILECKSKIQLLTIKGKLYCWNEGKLSRLNPETGKLKPTKKGGCLPPNASLFLASSLNTIITYAKIQKETTNTEGEVAEDIHGELIFYDLKENKVVNTMEITHTIGDLQQIVAVGDLLILAGKSKYVVFNTISKSIIKSADSELLKQSTLSVNSITNEIYAIFFVSDDDGLALGKFETVNIQVENIKALDDKIKEINEFMGKNSKDSSAIKKAKICSMLHMSEGKASKNEYTPTFASRIEIILALIAARSKEAEICVKSTKLTNENVMKFYNTPVAVHLTIRCFEAQINLVQLFFTELMEGKTEEAILLAMERLSCVLVILNQHMLSLKKCNISLKECTGETVNSKYEKLYHQILFPIAKENLLAKLPQKNADLINSLKKLSESCINYSQLLASVDEKVTITSLIQALDKILVDKKADENFHALVTSFNSPSIIELVANNIIEEDSDCLKLLNKYFEIEGLSFYSKSQSFLKGDPKISAILSSILNELNMPFNSLIELIFIKIGNKLQEKKANQNILIKVLPEMLYNHLKLFISTLRETYGQYRAGLLSREQELMKTRQFGVEYARYWKFIQTCLNKEIYLIHALNLLNTTMISLNTTPDQSLIVANWLQKIAIQFKQFFTELSIEKIVEQGENKHTFPLLQMDEYLENEDKPLTHQIIADKEYSFPEASDIHVKTMWDSDLPPPNTNVINIIALPKNESIIKLDRDNPCYDDLIPGNRVKISVNIEAVPKNKELIYKGYKLRIRPKYNYGQKILKEAFQKVLWTACFLSKMSLCYYEELKKVPGLTQKNQDLLSSILSSRVLSGGLPVSCFSTLFSTRFNKELASIQECAGLDLEGMEAMMKGKEDNVLADLKTIMNGGNEKVEKILTTLHNEYAARQPLARMVDPNAQEIVRYTFALLLHITNSIGVWTAVCDTQNPEEKDLKKISALWASANRMRMEYSEKKKAIPADKKGEQWEKELKAIATTIKEKVDLLLKFRSADIEEQEGLKATKKIKLIPRESEEKELSEPLAQQVKNRLGKWKDVQLAVAKDENKEMSLTSSALQILGSDFTCAQLISQLECYYLRGIILFAVISNCENILSDIHSKKIRADILAWIMSILNKSTTPQFHYTQLTTSCGVAFQMILRSGFFKIINQVLQYISEIKQTEEIKNLVDALKWNYSASDHVHIHKQMVFNYLCATSSNKIIANLWGKSLDAEDDAPELLLSTFEFITIKIATRILLSASKPKPQVDEIAKETIGLERSRSLFDTGSTAKLFETILRIIFGEIRRVVDSYSSSPGVEENYIESYNKIVKKSEEEESNLSKEKEKLMKELTNSEKIGYSHDFCMRILKLLYHLCVAVQEDPQFNATINLLVEDTDFLQLLKLLYLGSMQQHYLVLHIIPLIAKFSFENLDRAASRLLETQHRVSTYTKSSLIDFLIYYALEKRESIWFSQLSKAQGSYSISKSAIAAIRKIAFQNKDISTMLGSLIQTILFGNKESWNTLPKECRNKRLIELIISIAGGELESLYKGAKGISSGRKGYSIVCFMEEIDKKKKKKQEEEEKEEEKEDEVESKYKSQEWEFNPKKHKKIFVHMGGSEASTGINSVEDISISGFIPHVGRLLLPNVVQNVKKEVIAESVKKILATKALSKDALLETIKLKTIKVITAILKDDSDISKILYSEDFIKQLLDEAIKSPQSSSSKSLKTVEIIIEEIRKTASQSEGKALINEESSASCIKAEKNKLIFYMSSGSFEVPISAHKLIGKLSADAKNKYVKYNPETKPETVSEAVLILPKEYVEKVNLLEISKKIKGIVTDEDLKNIVEKCDKTMQIPLIEISTDYMKKLDDLFSILYETNKHFRSEKPELIIAEFVNVKPTKPIHSSNVREVIKDLLKGSEGAIEEKEKEAIKEVNHLRKLIVLNSKTKKMFGDSFNKQLQDEKTNLANAFNTAYTQLFDQCENPKPIAYINYLGDLRLFYVRRIITTLIDKNTQALSTLSYDTFKNLFHLMQLLTVEADYLKFGAKYKNLSKKVNKQLKVLLESQNGTKFFLQWLHEQVVKLKESEAYSILKSKEEELKNNIYGKFVQRCIKILAKCKPDLLIKYEKIGETLSDLLSFVATLENVPDKHHCLLAIKQILGSAEALSTTLSLDNLNNILTSKCLYVLSAFLNKIPEAKSMMWKNANEILLKANSLFRFSTGKFGEFSFTSCLKDDGELFAPIEVMKSFPDLKKLHMYAWTRLNAKEMKVKLESKIESPKPFYNTQYCVLINDPLAISFEVNPKIQSNKSGMLSLDKDQNIKYKLVGENENSIEVPFNKCYFHYPWIYYETYGFGTNEGGRLGFKDLANTPIPKIVKGLGMKKPVAIYTGMSHTFVLNSLNNLYTTGKGDGRLGAESNAFQTYKKDCSRIFATNQTSTMFYDPNEDYLNVIGKNPDGMFTTGGTTISNEETIKPKQKDIQQISMSNAHILVLYAGNTVFASPDAKKEFFGTWVEGKENNFAKIKFPDNITKITKVLALNSGSIILCTDSVTKKPELYSFGSKGSAAVGQGSEVKQEQYQRLDYPKEIEFIDLIGYANMAAAITANKELYTWGKAENGALGLYNPEGKIINEVNKPTKVNGLEKYNVISVSISLTHMLVLVEEKENKLNRKVFGFGDNSKGQLGDKDLTLNRTEISFFSDKSPYLVSAGTHCSFVCCGNKIKQVTHNAKCTVDGKSVYEILYLHKSKANGIKCWCKDCVSHLPKITYATRYPITKLEEKNWPYLENLEVKEIESGCVDCTLCSQKTKGSYYLSAVKEVTSALCETCFNKTPTTLTPVIFYRISSANIQIQNIPILSLNDFYERNNDIISLTLKPNYKIQFPEHLMEKGLKAKLDEFLEESKHFSKENDLDIVELISEHLIEKKKKVDQISLKNDLPINYSKKGALLKYDEEALKRRCKVLVKMNKIVEKAIKNIDFDSTSHGENDLYSNYSKVKEYVAMKTKDAITKEVFAQGQEEGGRGRGQEIKLDRHKSVVFKRSGKVDHNGEYSMFGQMWRQLKDNLKEFKKKAEEGQTEFPFHVSFRAEGGIDAGGLFRDSIDSVCGELQSSILPLLIPSPNNKAAYGECRELWTVNPSAKLPTHIQMYEFLGSLMGMSFRLSHLLPLSLPSLFWKQLMSDSVDRSDLKHIDTFCVQCLEDIANIEKKGIDKSTFSGVIDVCFVTRLSDGTEIELMKGGKNIKVDFDNRKEYANLVEKARLEEGQLQMKAIRAGLIKIVPFSIIKLYSWKELEYKICGKPTFKVEALKKITRYEDCTEKDDFIIFFWKALEEFTDEERSLYLKFVWGRSRMPTYAESYTHRVSYKRSSNPDATLPVAHTCFFQLELPPYSSVEKAKEKLRYAIKNCMVIDNDRLSLETYGEEDE